MRGSQALSLSCGLLVLLLGCQSRLAAQPASNGVNSAASSSLPNPLAPIERSMVFAPTRYPAGNWQPAGLQVEDAWFSARDNTRLHGWFVDHPQPRAVVLYCHGNGGNVAIWADALRVLHDRMGVAALCFDYRGYGRCEGTPSEAGVLADARAARAWLAQRTKIAENKIVLMGRSLGGAVAVDLAQDGARGLVLESTFTSMPAVGQTLMPWLPVRSMMQTRFDSLSKIRQYRGPLLQSHGTADRLIPYAMGRELFEAAQEPKRFIAIPGGDHNDPQTAEYYTALAEFLGQLPRDADQRVPGLPGPPPAAAAR